ncbi:POZ domain-containing protein [Apiospora arundinis]|uniref:S-adenosyl-L-methionine-dependent methyltransferase n=1 Tax=Apiospora arundinis TaxID=335852 RepID=A0ABR2J7N7_9PEZI
MVPPATDVTNNNHDDNSNSTDVAKNLQDQFRNIPASVDKDDAKRAMVQAMDRVVSVPGERLLLQAGLLPLDGAKEEPFALFDNACGTGLITSLLQKNMSPAVLRESRIVCADLNANLVDIVKWRAETDGWKGTVETAVLDAQDTGLPANSFSHVVISLAMHIIPNPEAALREAHRLLRPKGTLAFSVWAADNAGWIPDMRSAFAALPFAAPMPDRVPMAVHGLGQWVDPAGIRAELASFPPGLDHVRIETVEHATRVDSAEYFVEAFDMMRKWLVQSYWPEESRRAATTLGDAVLNKIMIKHLQEKYDGQGWNIRWKSILVSCQKQV